MDSSAIARQLGDPRELLVGLDFDGVLSPIVADPQSARIHPLGPDLLVRLAQAVRRVAIITGRPAAQAVGLGDLDRVADLVGAAGSLVVLGQYGAERWSATDRQVTGPPPPESLAAFGRDLTDLLHAESAADAWVEEKGLALAVHTRRMADPAAAYALLEGPVRALALRHGLHLEPGRMVLEVRAPGADKGLALADQLEQAGARGLLLIGDDLGDVPGFVEAERRRAAGLRALLVCSGSDEQDRLRSMADMVVDGPDGVMALLSDLLDHLST